MKKHHWHVFWHKKLFEKHPQPYCQTRSKPNARGWSEEEISLSIGRNIIGSAAMSWWQEQQNVRLCKGLASYSDKKKIVKDQIWR
jgi:hypothetical protein